MSIVSSIEGLSRLVRLRAFTALLMVASGVGVGLLESLTVANVQGDPRLPPVRVLLLGGCVSSSLLLLLLRDVLPDAERTAGVSLRAARLVWYLGVQAWFGGVVFVSAYVGSQGVTGAGLRAAAVCLFLGSLALLCGRVSVLMGLALPWLYVFTGLMIGYDAPVGGGQAVVRPWAWIVDDAVPTVPALAIASALTLCAALVGSRATSDADDVS